MPRPVISTQLTTASRMTTVQVSNAARVGVNAVVAASASATRSATENEPNSNATSTRALSRFARAGSTCGSLGPGMAVWSTMLSTNMTKASL